MRTFLLWVISVFLPLADYKQHMLLILDRSIMAKTRNDSLFSKKLVGHVLNSKLCSWDEGYKSEKKQKWILTNS